MLNCEQLEKKKKQNEEEWNAIQINDWRFPHILSILYASWSVSDGRINLGRNYKITTILKWSNESLPFCISLFILNVHATTLKVVLM